MVKRYVLACALLVAVPAASEAQRLTSLGPRIGASIDPDQLVLGGQITIGDFAPGWTFDPSLELGIGDDITTVQFNLDVNYHFDITDSDWTPHIGAGIGIVNYSIDREAPREDISDTEVGANIVLGFGVPTQSGNQFFGELRFGLGDLPELKLIGGYNFRM